MQLDIHLVENLFLELSTAFSWTQTFTSLQVSPNLTPKSFPGSSLHKKRGWLPLTQPAGWPVNNQNACLFIWNVFNTSLLTSRYHNILVRLYLITPEQKNVIGTLSELKGSRRFLRGFLRSEILVELWYYFLVSCVFLEGIVPISWCPVGDKWAQWGSSCLHFSMAIILNNT